MTATSLQQHDNSSMTVAGQMRHGSGRFWQQQILAARQQHDSNTTAAARQQQHDSSNITA
jgi:hypothetical protein